MSDTINTILAEIRQCTPIIAPLQNIVLLYAMTRGDLLIHCRDTHVSEDSVIEFEDRIGIAWIKKDTVLYGTCMCLSTSRTASVDNYIDIRGLNKFPSWSHQMRDYFESMADAYAVRLITI